LEDRLELPPEQLVLWLMADRGVAALLSMEQVNNTRIVLMLLSAVKKATEAGRSENLTELLIRVRDSNIFKSLSVFLNSVSVESKREQKDMEMLVDVLLFLLEHYMLVLPSDSQDMVSLLALVLESRILGLLGLERQNYHLNRIKERVSECRENRREKKIEAKKKVSGLEEPPDNFREISIFPTVVDISNKKPFLRKNIIGGAYRDLDTYLDIQFRLLREDFVRPLREGITDYKEGLKLGIQVGKVQNKDIRVYHDARILFPEITPQGITHQIQFSLDGLRNIRWENSKRLIFGSLVCLSSDNFQTLIFATIANRDPKKLAEGRIDVFFHDASSEDLTVQQTFVMVESSSYFEAYRHVLRSLQQVTETNMPFQKYIVGERRGDIDPFADEDDEDTADLLISDSPRYLTHTTTYDLTPLMKADCITQGKSVAVRSKLWPAGEAMDLDKSQLEAVKSALTSEVAVVQGPPGTGKTYIGLKIAEVLLLNDAVWNTSKGPILVLCYTNHALDQFLEGIMNFHDQHIVRVGSRSKNEALAKYSLSNLRSTMRKERLVPRDIHGNISDIRFQMHRIQEEILHSSVKMEAAAKHVLSERELEEILSDDVQDLLVAGFAEISQGDFMLQGKQKKPKSILAEWLGVGSSVRVIEMMGNMEVGQNRRNEEEVANDEEIDVDEDAQHEEDKRVTEADQDLMDFLKNNEKRKQAIKDEMDIAFDMNEDEHDVADGQNAGNQRHHGWQVSRKEKRRRMNLARKELMKHSMMSTAERQQKESLLWYQSSSDRWRLYRTWVRDYVLLCQDRVKRMQEEYNRHSRRLAEVRDQESLHILKTAKVVGMTTTGAAKLHTMLQDLKPSIMIVEEAAEVLEAHIVAGLTASCQHLILIGDHQQLRPNPTVFELCRTYNLDISLFERLIKNNLKFSRLENQHRMLPAISKLLVPHIYEELRDHESVMRYPLIRGVSSNMFFINHERMEVSVTDGHSKVNEHEAMFLVELCRYLLKQGYNPNQITILTTYSGQLFAFKKKMPRSEFTGVRVSTVDNYQGEENDIILLSLVRSNKEGAIGFLGIDNRVCVALSRARHALYCIGNFSQLCSKSVLWEKILTYVHREKMVGDGILLQCQQHPKYEQMVKDGPSIRQKFPEGGCTVPCSARLSCGHTCQLSCHSWDPRHDLYKCRKVCGQVRPDCPHQHKCKLSCFQDCGPCPDKIQAVLPVCGHSQQVRCGEDLAMVVCRDKCDKTRECGHKCMLICGIDCSDPANFCMAKSKVNLGCGHSKTVFCYQTSRIHECNTRCTSKLECDHPCPGTCHTCSGARLHSPCSQVCGRLLVCGHVCRERCGLPCLCQAQCQTRCGHSACTRTCGEACVPCIEPCLRACPHNQCSALCSQPCTGKLCSQPCKLLLPCGHPCIGLCGEQCPAQCRVCNSEEVTQVFFGPEDEPEARFVELADCHHVVHAESMDSWVEQAGASGLVGLPECPRCKTAVRTTGRYNVVKHLIDVERAKTKLRGEEGTQMREELEVETRALVTAEIQTVDEKEKPLYSDKEKEKLIQLVKTLLTPEKAVSIHKLRNTKELLRFILILKRLTLNTRQLSKAGLQSPSTAKAAGLDTRKMGSELSTELSKLEAMLMTSLLKGEVFSSQQMKEANNEVSRLQHFMQFYQFCRDREKKSQSFSSKTVQVMDNMKKLLTNIWVPFTGEQVEVWRELNAELSKSCSGLGVSDVERREILAAMGLQKGHWYTCPNGHVYAIGECGGATQEGTCPECGERIGGTSHRLLDTNRIATQMDGATRSSYPWGVPEQ